MLVAPSESISLPNSTKFNKPGQARPIQAQVWPQTNLGIEKMRAIDCQLRNDSPSSFKLICLLRLVCQTNQPKHCSKTKSPFKERQEDILKAINQDNALKSLSHASGGFKLQELALFWLNKIQQKRQQRMTWTSKWFCENNLILNALSWWDKLFHLGFFRRSRSKRAAVKTRQQKI